ncbi:FIG146085: 3'-to-5' oligoribonuclease A, Bacillus type [hydrothermal vent metagenome]|uniref:FIG146085: 3'-to-5' oligoribonuclease A, Bacillus type n=1 Tax=hydrothermal vent metagenome TaxID=652676 RepID=A0A1W1BHN3_9ZZZZ
MIKEVQSLINNYNKITIITHINPDADTIGTALGIYGLLNKNGKQVEVVNYGLDLPINLDFLPYFSKIKNRINYEDSLVISCDAGSIDRLGFDLKGRTILSIDHHKSNTNFGLINVVDTNSVSASEVAYKLFKDKYVITKEVATCFYAGLVSDTHCFTTSNVSTAVFNLASEIMSYGVDISNVVKNLNQRRSLASLRILSSSLNTLELDEDGALAIISSTKKKMLEAGADLLDTVGIVDYGISLVTVEIAIILIELDGMIRVSLRSKNADVSSLAIFFGGGGHHNSAGFEVLDIKIEELKIMIKKEIKERGLLHA